MTTPYTYIIGWPELDIWYYGVRYASGCHPDDLWNPYKTSSDYVSEFVNIHGEPSVRKVRRTFAHLNDPVSAARLWENKVLKRMKVVESSRWLNKTDNQGIPPLYGEDHPHYGKTGSSHHSYGKANHGASEFQKNLWEQGIHPILDKECQKVSIQKRSGDNHHMKRAEVVEKISGVNHYSKVPGYQSKITGDNNPMKKGYKFKRVQCSNCGKDFGASGIKRHTEWCEANFTKMLENSDDIEYNKS